LSWGKCHFDSKDDRKEVDDRQSASTHPALAPAQAYAAQARIAISTPDASGYLLLKI